MKPANPASTSHFNQHAKWCEPYLTLQAIFEPTRKSKPCEKSSVIPHQITYPSKPFSNRHAKPRPVSQSRHFSTDYLPLQAIFKPTHQAPWSSPVIPHQITCPSKPFLNRHDKRYEPVPSFLIGLIIHKWLLWHKKISLLLLMHIMLPSSPLADKYPSPSIVFCVSVGKTYKAFLWGDT